MIELDFKQLEQWSIDLDATGTDLLQELELGFYGALRFKVNGIDFSGDYPALDFAHSLASIAHSLKENGGSAYYVDPEFEKQSKTEFYLVGEEVHIKEVNWRDNSILVTASVHIDELISAADEYLAKIFDHCCNLIPEMRENQVINQWISSRPKPDPCKEFERLHQKSPKIVRIGFDE